MSYESKDNLTEDEHILISRYPEDVQEDLKQHLLKDKAYASYSYKGMIEAMEEGRKISFTKATNGVQVTIIGELNTALFARLLLQFSEGRTFKPLKSELEHDGRLEEFKQYPKGTKVKANGEIVY